MMIILQNEFSLRQRGWQLLLLVFILIVISLTLSIQYQNFLEATNDENTIIPPGLVFRILSLLIMIFNFPLVLAISHSSIIDDQRSGRLPFYLTKMSCAEFIFGKFIGIVCFWLIVIIFSYAILTLNYEGGSLIELINICAIPVLSTGITVLLSSFFTKSAFILPAGLVTWVLLLIPNFLIYPNEYDPLPLQFLVTLFWTEKPNIWMHLTPIILGLICSLIAVPLLRRRNI